MYTMKKGQVNIYSDSTLNYMAMQNNTLIRSSNERYVKILCNILKSNKFPARSTSDLEFDFSP